MPIAVIDLSYLEGRSIQDIRRDMSGYSALITAELIYEIVTNSRGNDPRVYLDKLRSLDLHQSRPLLGLVHEEIRRNEAASNLWDSCRDKSFMEFIELGTGGPADFGADEEVKRLFEVQEPTRLKDAIGRMWEARFNDLFENIPCGPDVAADATTYLGLMNRPEMPGHGKAIAEEHHLSMEPGPGWLIYEWERLRNFLAFRYRLQGNRPEQIGDKQLANNLMDLHYVAFLCRADAIATRDQRLMAPLAKAFGAPTITLI